MANKIYDAFDHIQADKDLKESTKKFLSAKRRKSIVDVYRPVFQRMFAVVCMILVVAAGIKGYSWVQTPVSYVSIDVNPSIELELNRFDKVVTVTAYNEEAEGILNGLSLKGRKYTDAIQIIVESKAMQGYLTEESEIYFTVAAKNNYEYKIEKGVEHYCGHMEHKAKSVCADIELVSKAHSQGLSLGKYYAYLQLIQYDDTVTVDHCKDMSISEIHGLISEHEQSEEHEHEQSGEHEHGQSGEHEHEKEDKESMESAPSNNDVSGSGEMQHHNGHRDKQH